MSLSINPLTGGSILFSGSSNPLSSEIVITRDNVEIPAIQIDKTLKALKQDVGLGASLANDRILITALQNPSQFIQIRGELIEAMARLSLEAAVNAVSLITRGRFSDGTSPDGGVAPFIIQLRAAAPVNVLINIGDEVANDMIRKISGATLSVMIQQVDSIFDGVKARTLEKLTNV